MKGVLIIVTTSILLSACGPFAGARCIIPGTCGNEAIREAERKKKEAETVRVRVDSNGKVTTESFKRAK